MTDTSPKIERMMRDKLMAFSGEERLVMGAQMSEMRPRNGEGVAAAGLVGSGAATAIVQTPLWRGIASQSCI